MMMTTKTRAHRPRRGSSTDPRKTENGYSDENTHDRRFAADTALAGCEADRLHRARPGCGGGAAGGRGDRGGPGQALRAARAAKDRWGPDHAGHRPLDCQTHGCGRGRPGAFLAARTPARKTTRAGVRDAARGIRGGGDPGAGAWTRTSAGAAGARACASRARRRDSLPGRVGAGFIVLYKL